MLVAPSEANVSMNGPAQVVIVGGGVAGCATAYYLGQAGIKATVVEREGIGSQASGFSAGGLNPLQGILGPLAPFALASYRLHLALWPELERLTGHGCDARLITVVFVALKEADLPELREYQAVFEATDGFSARWLEPADLRALEPRLTPRAIGGVALEGNGVVDSFAYTSLLAEAARRLGATVRAGEVQGLQRSGGRVTGVILADGVLPADQVVIALGPWTGQAERWLGTPLPIEPVKGEICRMALDGPPLPVDFHSSDIGLYRRAGEQVWCGTTIESRGFDREPSQAARETILARAVELMPAIAEARLIKQTACLRPVAPDGLPILGRAPGWENVYLATGAGKKGILLSAGMGKSTAELIATGTTTLDIAACSAERFVGVSA
jgi:glycine oxidase